MNPQPANQPAAPGEMQHTPTLVEFVAEIDRMIDAERPRTHLWNYCVWHRKGVLRNAVRHQMDIQKVLAHHELMPGRVAANTENLLADLEAVNSHAALVAEVAELRKALQPLADIGNSAGFDATTPDDVAVISGRSAIESFLGTSRTIISVGDVRRARALLAGKEGA